MKLKSIPLLQLPVALMLLLEGCSENNQPLSSIDATGEARVETPTEVQLDLTPGAIPTGSISKTSATEEPMTQRRDKIFGDYLCTQDGTKPFTAPFFATDLITRILPMGKVSSGTIGHVTPTDHLYILRDVPPSGTDLEYVSAPADGIIVQIQRMSGDKRLDRNDPSSPLVPDYRLVFMHTCTFFTIFIHLGELAPDIAEKTGEIAVGDFWFPTRTETIRLKAGEPLAKFGRTSFDWSVHDADTTLAGFVVPEHYRREPWKIHTVDPFQFYEEPIKSDLITKTLRIVEPISGKIDYDIEDTIAGTWFMDGTVDYSGNVVPGEPRSPRYWNGHLSIAYGYIDPTQIRISIGFETGINDDLYCKICVGAYGVRENQPDPATVGPDSGLVKYELMSRKDVGPDEAVKEQVGTTSLGTFLVQHLGNRTIQVEVIPDRAPDAVAGFSDASLIYRR